MSFTTIRYITGIAISVNIVCTTWSLYNLHNTNKLYMQINEAHKQHFKNVNNLLQTDKSDINSVIYEEKNSNGIITERVTKRKNGSILTEKF